MSIAGGAVSDHDAPLIPWLSAYQMLVVAHHEGGHAVAAVVLGEPIDYVTMVPSVDGFALGHTRSTRLPTTADEKRSALIVSLAGPIAEARFRALPITKIRDPLIVDARIRLIEARILRPTAVPVAELTATLATPAGEWFDDEEAIDHWSRELAADDATDNHLRVLTDARATADVLVTEYSRQIRTVALELLLQTTIAGARLAALVAPACAVVA